LRSSAIKIAFEFVSKACYYRLSDNMDNGTDASLSLKSFGESAGVILAIWKKNSKMRALMRWAEFGEIYCAV
jgi:hypothetical protein